MNSQPRDAGHLNAAHPPIEPPSVTTHCCWWMRDRDGAFMVGSSDGPCEKDPVYQIKGAHGKGALYCAEHAWHPGYNNIEAWDGLKPAEECRLHHRRLAAVLDDMRKSMHKTRDRSLAVTHLEDAISRNLTDLARLTGATLVDKV